MIDYRHITSLSTAYQKSGLEGSYLEKVENWKESIAKSEWPLFPFQCEDESIGKACERSLLALLQSIFQLVIITPLYPLSMGFDLSKAVICKLSSTEKNDQALSHLMSAFDTPFAYLQHLAYTSMILFISIINLPCSIAMASYACSLAFMCHTIHSIQMVAKQL